jgi:hypothetical protein
VLADLGFDQRQIRAAQGLEDAECVGTRSPTLAGMARSRS